MPQQLPGAVLGLDDAQPTKAEVSDIVLQVDGDGIAVRPIATGAGGWRDQILDANAVYGRRARRIKLLKDLRGSRSYAGVVHHDVVPVAQLADVMGQLTRKTAQRVGARPDGVPGPVHFDGWE